LRHLVPTDEMARRLNLVQGSLDVIVPRTQLIVRLLLLVIEYNDALESVNLSEDTFVHHHVADLLLSSLQRDTSQCGQSVEADAAVILFDHSQVVLNQLSDQVTHMLLAVTSSILERLVLTHLSLNFGLVHWHELVSQHFANKFADQRLNLELTGVVSLNYIQKVNFFV
jgi:hypothetical protein